MSNMIDEQKVLKGLRQHCDGSLFDRCGLCPYYDIGDKPFECRDALLKDVRNMLKGGYLWTVGSEVRYTLQSESEVEHD